MTLDPSWPTTPSAARPPKADLEYPEEVKAALADPTKRIAHYAILGELGRGGMGVVYRGYDTKLRRSVAVKMILDPTRAGTDVVQRLSIEASAAARIEHPNIVRVHEVGEHEGKPFIVMELIRGRSFEAELRQGKTTPERAAEVLRDVARALDQAHQAGIIHRDVKPENILVDEQGKPHLMDFGLARESTTTERLTVAGSVLGTPGYMSPEQAGGVLEAQGPLTDVYGLGAVLYRALAGRPVFEGASLNAILVKILQQSPEPLTRIDPSVPRDLETIALRCLAKESERRYASAGAVADELDRFLRHEPIVARPIGGLERLGLWVRRNRALAVALGLVGVALAAALAIGLYSVKTRAADARAIEKLELIRSGGEKKAAGDQDGAIAAFTSAIALDPQDAAVYSSRAALYQARRSWDLAIADVRSITAIVPRDPHAWAFLGDLERQKSDWKEAVSAYDRAVALDPLLVAARRWRGFAKLQEGDADGALDDLGKAAELEPRSALTFIYMGDAHVKKKDDAAAKSDFTQAIDLDPRNPDPWYRRGNALMRAKAWAFAISDFSRAIELRRFPVYFRERGHAYRAKGEKEKAIEDLEEYLKLAPKAVDAKRIHSDLAALRK